jgi:hypothetical protein
MLLCTRSKTLFTSICSFLEKKFSIVFMWNIFHKWDIMFQEAWVFLKLSLYL